MTFTPQTVDSIEPSRTNTGPSFAFVIEWDNARLAELSRARQMLKAVQEQAIAHRPKPSRPPQVIILYDKQEIDPRLIEQVVAETIDPKAWDATIEIVATNGLKYYELKNYGVSQTDRDIIVFIDSDVIPEPDWLSALLSAIDDPGRSVVCGNTYVSMDTFLGKSFNLFWFFEIRSKTNDIREFDYIYANNVAFKREILEKYSYPDLESFRGQCHALSEDLKRDGIIIYRHDGARVSHPPPNGLSHFYKRAICEGHDEMTICRARNAGTRRAKLAGSFDRFRGGIRLLLNRAANNRRDVGLSLPATGAAVLVGGTYWILKLFGEIVTYVNPSIVRKYWSI